MQWTFPAAGPQQAELNLPSGRVEIGLAPTDEVRVLLEPVGPRRERALEMISETSVTCDDGKLIVDVPRRKMRDAPLRLAVIVPPRSDIECSTASADVFCRGEVGSIKLRTASGDVVVEGRADAVEVATASGDVRLPEVLGEAHIRTASGDVVAGSVGGQLSVDTASGDVGIGPASHDVRVRTASGDVRLAQAVQGELSVHSASGDVRIGVARGVGTWLDVTTVSGTTRCTLQSENSGPEAAALRITCRTVSGDVYISPSDLPSAVAHPAVPEAG